jgi:hypothetical protein
MVRIAVIACWVCSVACSAQSSGDDGQQNKIPEDIAEIHKDLRDLREEQRALRAELRELRDGKGPRLTTDDTDDIDDTDTATETDAGAGEAKADTKTDTAKQPEIKSSPAAQETVRISIASNPQGARVYIGGKVMGRTPVLLERAPGADTIDIRVEKEGYRARILTVRPEEDTKLSVQLAKK